MTDFMLSLATKMPVKGCKIFLNVGVKRFFNDIKICYLWWPDLENVANDTSGTCPKSSYFEDTSS